MEIESVKEAPSLKGKIIYVMGTTMGCDPEFFIEQDGKIVGSEMVIPEKGLDCITPRPTDALPAGWTRERYDEYYRQATLVQDGVQVELNPKPSSCRQTLTSEMALAFKTLQTHLAKTKGIKASFASVIEMDPKELEKLSEKAKILGCAPSMSAHKTASINVDATKYMKRSAGGHFHFGTKSMGLKASPDQIATMMDILVGNTAVLMDRDPEAAERRKLYGRAGEYRTPPHGFEYRTCSNFWLRDSKIMSALLGLGRMAISTLYTNEYRKLYHPAPRHYDWNPEEELHRLVDVKAVKEAINTNNVELAKENFKGVKRFIREHVPNKLNTGLDSTTLKPFDYFIHMIDLHGLWYWFPVDPMEHWTNLKGIPQGFESYLDETVTRLMAKDTEWLVSYKD